LDFGQLIFGRLDLEFPGARKRSYKYQKILNQDAFGQVRVGRLALDALLLSLKMARELFALFQVVPRRIKEINKYDNLILKFHLRDD